ncbi:hypothetical protein ACOSQ2_009399 [Xanthoceras sorbifolium]
MTLWIIKWKSSASEDTSFSDLNDDLDEDFKTGPSKGNKTVSGRNSQRTAGENTSFSNSNSKMDNRKNSMNDGNRSSRGSRGDNRESKWDDYGGRRMNDKRGD